MPGQHPVYHLSGLITGKYKTSPGGASWEKLPSAAPPPHTANLGHSSALQFSRKSCRQGSVPPQASQAHRPIGILGASIQRPQLRPFSALIQYFSTPRPSSSPPPRFVEGSSAVRHFFSSGLCLPDLPAHCLGKGTLGSSCLAPWK